MLYLDYSRKAGEWIPNSYGGRRELEAIDFLKTLNETDLQAVSGRDDGRRGVHGLAGRLAPDLPRRPRLRLQVEHGVDERLAALHVQGSGPPQVTTRTSSPSRCSTPSTRTSSCVLSHDEVVARQAGPAGQDARRHVAEVRQPARCSSRSCSATPARSCSSWAASCASGTSGTAARASTGTSWSTSRTRR